MSALRLSFLSSTWPGLFPNPYSSQALKDGYLTPDLGGNKNTRQVSDAVIENTLKFLLSQ
jgi:hypothetical protein